MTRSMAVDEDVISPAGAAAARTSRTDAANARRMKLVSLTRTIPCTKPFAAQPRCARSVLFSGMRKAAVALLVTLSVAVLASDWESKPLVALAWRMC